MKKFHVVFDFIGISIPEKTKFGRNVITKMTGNANFPAPDVSLSALAEKTNKLEEKSIAALNGGKPETALMHKVETEWDDLMRLMALYVDRIADGNDAMILDAGFNLEKQRAPLVRSELSAEVGDLPCTVSLRRQAYKGAKAYIWQICMNELPVDENGWTITDVTSKASVVIENLTPLTKYWFRVAVVTSQGTTAYTAPIMQATV